jgi:uncharacterized protein YfdQ (DUF2303 family)
MSTGSKSDITTHVVAEEAGPVFSEYNHPLTGEPILLRDPELEEVIPTRSYIKADTVESFAAAVKTIAGPNKLIELHKDGSFVYRDALAGYTKHTVTTKLEAHPTARMLCVEQPRQFKQRDLVKFMSQWPDVLSVEGDESGDLTETAVAAIEHFEVKNSTSFSSTAGDHQVSIAALKEAADPEQIKIPLYWQVTSPLFDGGKDLRARLRLEVQVPEIRDNKLQGELLFCFELWSPAAQVLKDDAMADVIERMGNVLNTDEYTIIRGEIS